MTKVPEKGGEGKKRRKKKKKNTKRDGDKALGYNSNQTEKDFENKGMFIYAHQQCYRFKEKDTLCQE